MRLKSYHTVSVESAIRLAHIELGDDAVFLGSRRNDVGSDPNQAYEVTFAVMEGERGEQDSVAAAARAIRGDQPSGGRKRPSPAAPDEETAATSGRPTNHKAAGPADQGAFTSWKKLLRHVTVRGGKAVRDEGDSKENEDKEPAEGRKAPATRRNGLAARGGALPHWKEFVPGELRDRGSETQSKLTDAARVAEAGSERAPARAPVPESRNGIQKKQDGRNVRTERATTERMKSSPAHATSDRSTEIHSLETLSAELDELRRLFERQQAGGNPLILPSRELLSDARLARFFRSLSDNAVEPTLAAEIVSALENDAAQGADPKRLAGLLAREMRRRFKTNSELGRGNSAVDVAALVGPSGAGKTTAAAKLAFRCGVLRRRRVRLLSVDQLRIGAVEPLQAYAELMNAPLQIVDDFDRLSPALDALAPGDGPQRDLVLIDTPGYGRRERERSRRLAATFLERADIDVHLVLDLRTKTEDLHRAVEQFQAFRPAKLLFTRLDETSTFGTMLNETVRTGLPLSFVSVGQRVPEDIVPAGEPELLRLLLRDRTSS